MKSSNRPISLLRLLPVTLLCVIGLVTGCGDFQMNGTLGRPAAQTLQPLPAYWSASAFPEALEEKGELPPLRATVYNLHSGLGADWRLFASRDTVEANIRSIARDIAGATPAEAPDVVALNEVDFGSRRSGWIDQARFLSDELLRLSGHRYRIVRGETWRRDLPGMEVRFGNALLVRHRVTSVHSAALGEAPAELPAPLPAAGLLSRFFGERRGVVRATLDFHGHPVDVIATHLEAFVLQQRETQAAEILSQHVRPGVSTVLLGDINAVPTAMTARRDHFAADRTHDILTSDRLVDARVSLAARSGATDLSSWATYPAESPEWPLDAAFATSDLLAESAGVIGGTASDHRGLTVRYTLLEESAAARQFAWHDSLRRRQLQRILNHDIRPSGITREQRTAWLLAATGFGDLLDNATEATVLN